MRSVSQQLLDMLADAERAAVEEQKELLGLEEECARKRNTLLGLNQQVQEIQNLISKVAE